MIVNSVSLYKPYTSKANKTTNALPQEHTSPAFTGSEKPSMPRKSVFGGLRTLLLGGTLLATTNCGSANNTPDALPALDASAPIATIDSAVPTAAIDAMPNTGITAADILLDMHKKAGILPQSATKLANVTEYDSPSSGLFGLGVAANPKEELSHVVETLSESDTNRVVCNGTITTKKEVIPYSVTYTVNPDNTLTKSMKLINPQNHIEIIAYSCKMSQNNGFIELSELYIPSIETTDAGIRNIDAGTLMQDYKINMQKSGSGEIGFKILKSGNVVNSGSYTGWTNDGVLAMIPKKAEALAEQFGKVTHDLRTGELRVPIGRGKVAVIADLAKDTFRRACI